MCIVAICGKCVLWLYVLPNVYCVYVYKGLRWLSPPTTEVIGSSPVSNI